MISYLILIAVGVVVFTWFIVGNIFAEKNNARTVTSTAQVKKRTDLDSDSENEGLFGKQQRSSSLFDAPKHPAVSQGLKSTINTDSSAPGGSVKLPGVENVRAMPDATPSLPTSTIKSKEKNNLFASDSDDDGDLFSSKPATSGKITNNLSHKQVEPPVPSSGGLFSSDEDSPLFAATTPIQESKNNKEENEESSQSKEIARKVPVGGVNIFGTAITSALRQSQLLNEESSEDEKPNADNIKDTKPPSAKPDDRASQPPNVKLPVKGGLFDSDEEDNLFDALVRKPGPVTDVTKETSSKIENKNKTENTKIKDNESISNTSRKESPFKSSGLFSDEEDSIFSIPSTSKNKEVSFPGGKTQHDKSPEVVPKSTKAKQEAVKESRPASLFTPPEHHQTPSQPVSISEPSKSAHSLFSSPSDDDDDLFSSISKPVSKVSHSSAFMTDPPPLPPQSANTHKESSSKDLPQPDKQNDADISSTKTGGHKENVKVSTTSSLFISTSDEDIFSSVIAEKKSLEIPKPQPSKNEDNYQKPNEEPEESTKSTEIQQSVVAGHSDIGTSSGVPNYPINNTFKPVSQSSNNNLDQSKETDESIRTSKGLSDPFLEEKINVIDDFTKDNNIFGSTNDLFSVGESSYKPDETSKRKEDLNDIPKPDAQQSPDSTTSSKVTSDINKTVNSDLQNNDNATIINKFPSSHSPSSSHEPADALVKQEPKENVTKPPIGGVALFGGKELSAQINKRRTLYEPGEEEKQNIKSEIFEDIHDSAPVSEEVSKAVLFDESDDDDDDIFGNVTGYSEKSTGKSLYRQSPPLLPKESEKTSTEQESKKAMFSKSNSIDLDTEPQKSHDKDLKKPKPDNSEPENKEEIKPRKKPPIGGVSMFGGGGIGGSELFERVLQRKSMLALESDSSEEETPTEPTETTTPEENVPQPKPVLPNSPLSPSSPVSPVFAPSLHESKSGGKETSVSFDDPTTHSNVLHSVNKTRVRGSIKRRPPSRAHRKGSDKPDPTGAQESSPTSETPSPSSAMPGSVEQTNIKLPDTRKAESVQYDEKPHHQSANITHKEITKDIKKDEREAIYTNNQAVLSHKGADVTENVISGLQDKDQEVVAIKNKDDIFNAPRSALTKSKTSSKQSSSLFGGSDSDEELFGGRKKQPEKNSGAKSAVMISNKSSRSHSLFDDDDDDDGSIFAPTGQTKKVKSGPPKNVSVSRPKGNLKQSSEPFEDPLLGSMKK